jgi:peptide/nickel transport system permease protein
VTVQSETLVQKPGADPVEVASVVGGEAGESARHWLRLRTFLVLVPAAAVLVIAVIGPLMVPYNPRDVVAPPDLAPGGQHWFGTDASGLDVFSRTIASTQNDLLIAVATVLVATVTGIAIGLLVGMNESRRGILGLFARGISRALDLMQAVPAIVVGLVLVGFFGASIPSLITSLAVILTPNQGRLVRTEVLRVRGEAYLDASRMAGDREITLVLRHVLPNAAWPALENTTLVFGSAIVIAGALGFLGVGLHPPTPEWGNMIAVGAPSAATGRWWSALFPAIALAITVFATSALGRRLFGDDR